MTDDHFRITDLSNLSPSDIRNANLNFLSMSGSEYDIIPGTTKLRTRKEIQRVAESDLDRLFTDFPIDEPLQQQCAHWFHAVAGRHFFPDANHRTAVVTLRELLAQNRLDSHVNWPQDPLIQSVKRSKKIRRKTSITSDTLYRRDELFDHWLGHFSETVNLPE